MGLLVSANDAKLVRTDGVDSFPVDAGPDTLTVLDDSDGSLRRLTEVDVLTSIMGPPQCAAVSADGRWAAVSAPVSYDRDARRVVLETFLQVVDLTAGSVTRVPLDAHPQGVSFTPDAARLLVATAGGAVEVFAVTDEFRHVSTVDVSSGRLAGIAVTPDGSAAIVALRDEQGAAVLDLAGPVTLRPERVTTGVSPYVVDIDDAGRWALIGSVGEAGKAVRGGSAVADADVVTLVDLSGPTYRAVSHIGVPSVPEGIAISPDGRWAVALCMAGCQLPPGTPGHQPDGRLVLLAVDDGQLRTVDSVPAGAAAQGVVFTADSTRVVAQFYADRCLAVFAVEDGRLRDNGERIAVPGGPASLRRS